MDREEYNGWTNFDTWLMALNIDSDEGSYRWSREIVKEHQFGANISKVADALKDWVDETFYHDETDVWKVFDTWDNRSFHNIDWYDIAENWLGEIND